MKAICIKNFDDVNSRTTIGKVYEILQDYDSDYKTFDPTSTYQEYFVTVEQHRENQLNLIGIE
jgi:hypothetical protein